MKKLLLLGSVASPCPPTKQGGTERVVYYQAKHLAKLGVDIILVAAKGSKANFSTLLSEEGEQNPQEILSHIEFIEIGGGTQVGNAVDSIKLDFNTVESSRKLRIEIAFLTQVYEVIHLRKNEFELILNNMRGGEAFFLPVAQELGKEFFTVMHVNIFDELAELFEKYKTHVITIGQHQRENFPNVSYSATIYNPINTNYYAFQETPKDFAFMSGTIGYHKNQSDAVEACAKAGVHLVLAGKIRDQKYFDDKIQPWIDKAAVTYKGEISSNEERTLYQDAKVFLFPIKQQEPFGLVAAQALSCGTPVIAYPNGGPKEIIIDGENGFLVQSVDEIADRIAKISQINRTFCREDAVRRFDEQVIGKEYFETIKAFL